MKIKPKYKNGDKIILEVVDCFIQEGFEENTVMYKIAGRTIPITEAVLYSVDKNISDYCVLNKKLKYLRPHYGCDLAARLSQAELKAIKNKIKEM